MKSVIKYSIVITLVLLLYSEVCSQSITWQRYYRTKGNPIVTGITNIIQTDDEGYIFIGRSASLFAYGIDKFGDSLWYKEYSFAPANIIHKLSDGNYMIIDAYCTLIKITSTGDTIWTKFRSFSTHLLLGHRSVYYNNEFYIAGFNGYNNKPYILRLDSLGNDIFLKEFNYDHGGSNALLVNGNNIYLTGYSLLPYNYFLIKTNLLGDIIWIKDYNKMPLNFDGNAIIKVPHEESIILGGGSIENKNIAAALMKRDTSGNIIWQQNYISNGSSSAFFTHIMNDKSGNVISFGGTTQIKGNRALLLKTDYEGNKIWRKQYIANDNYETRCFRVTLDSGYIMGGLTSGDKPISIIKTDKLGSVVSIDNNNDILSSDIALLQNYPNPFNPSTTISYYLPAAGEVKLIIYDILGKEIATLVNEKQYAGKHDFQFSIDNYQLGSGVYFYRLSAGNFSDTRKLVLLK